MIVKIYMLYDQKLSAHCCLFALRYETIYMITITFEISMLSKIYICLHVAVSLCIAMKPYKWQQWYSRYLFAVCLHNSIKTMCRITMPFYIPMLQIMLMFTVHSRWMNFWLNFIANWFETKAFEGYRKSWCLINVNIWKEMSQSWE